MAEKRGQAWLNGSEMVDITVRVIDTNSGIFPVIVEWPFFHCRFSSLTDVRIAFMAFGQFANVPKEIRMLVNECLDELGVENLKAY